MTNDEVAEKFAELERMKMEEDLKEAQKEEKKRKKREKERERKLKGKTQKAPTLTFV